MISTIAQTVPDLSALSFNERVLLLASIIGIGSILLSLIGSGIALFFGLRVTHDQKRELAELSREKDIQIEKVRIELANAQREASEAQLALKKYVEEVDARDKPRHLTPEQRRTLIGHLGNSPKGQIEIRCVKGNPEAFNFGEEIVQVFRDSGWEVKLFVAEILMPTVVGISLRIHASEREGKTRFISNPPERAFSIIEAFENAGIPLSRVGDGNVPDGQLVLIVGLKQ